MFVETAFALARLFQNQETTRPSSEKGYALLRQISTHVVYIEFLEFSDFPDKIYWRASEEGIEICPRLRSDMVSLAQLVRASGCGPEGHGFEPHSSPHRSHPEIQLFTVQEV